MDSTQNRSASAKAKAIARRMPTDNDTTCTIPTGERFTFDKGRVRFKRDTTPRLLPGVVLVPVGPAIFELRRVAGAVIHPDGSACNGLCYPEHDAVFIDVNLSPGVRLRTTWHELGHAMLAVYNIGQRERLGEEAICDAMGAFMAGLSPEKYSEIVHFIACEDAAA